MDTEGIADVIKRLQAKFPSALPEKSSGALCLYKPAVVHDLVASSPQVNTRSTNGPGWMTRPSKETSAGLMETHWWGEGSSAKLI